MAEVLPEKDETINGDGEPDQDQEQPINLDPSYFNVYEKVLVFHGPLIYEARIISIPKPKPDAVELFYKVHYSGWNKKWDENVPQSRILKLTEDNLRRQKEHKLAHDTAQRSGGGGKKSDSRGGRLSISASTSKNVESISGASTVIDGGGELTSTAIIGDESTKGNKIPAPLPSTAVPPEAKKRKLEAHVEPEIRFINKQEVEIVLPDKLKAVLVDDFDKINRQKKLIILPGRVTVAKLLETYKNHLEQVNPKTPDSQLIFVEGIKDFFNILIGSQLLYPFEREQYAEFFEKVQESEEQAEKENLEPLSMSMFYGPVHMIRLFTKLGTSLAFTTMEEIPLMIFKIYAEDLLQYLVKNEAEFFQSTTDYTMSLPDYQRVGPM